MRKLTGYIGAMIIVFALMGSVLMGYALNVNGTNTIVNEYEKVTDVSGLYAHSEEKSYIDYNPATNYISYEGATKYTNTPASDYLTARQFYGENTFRFYNEKIYVNGVEQSPIVSSTSSAKCVLFADKTYIVKNPNVNYFNWVIPGQQIYTNNITVAQDATTGALTITGYDTDNNPFGVVYSNNNLVVYYTGNDITRYDYYYNRGTDLNGDLPAYYSGSRPIYSIGAYMNSTFTSSNYDIFYINSQTADEITLFPSSYISPNVRYSSNVNYGGVANYTFYHVFYPRTITGNYGDTIGINYERSNRVNNYPYEYDYNQYTTTQTATVNLMALSAANQFTYNDGWYIGLGSNSADSHDGYYSFAGYFKIKNGVYEYKLSDILSTLTIPAGTTTINIDTGQLNLAVAYTTVSVPSSIASLGYLPVYSSVPYNTELTTIFPNSNQYAGQVTTDNQFNYGIYYTDTGLIDIFDKRNNVKLWTASASDAVIRFVDSSTNAGVYDYNYNGYVNDNYVSGTNGTGFNLGVRGTPQLNLTYTINGAITNTYYMDITKGVSIKQTANMPVIWDNQYENGVIDLLFRAESTTESYHNDFTVSNNTVSVDFNGGRYSVTLNGGDPVDIGTWRNIVLSIDLINGKLYAIPVKTFNSYTNVVLTNTSVTIGDLVGAQPTNTISWATTNKSFTFNVYSTKVFMDTYGLIMVDPSLNITDYFTDLNQFYRLDMYNFATYGDSMTINGETLPVNNGLVTYGNKSLELRNFSVTYADGKVSIGDNHTSIEMGAIVTTNISMTGAWYFLTDLERGYTTQKVIYDWDWGTFIFDNTQFCIFYLGFMAAALIVARKYCSITITDYAVIVISIIIALGVQVIA